MAHPSLNAVKSSAIVAYRHRMSGIAGIGELVVEFTSGRIYHYAVPPIELSELDAAPSKGTFVNQLKQRYVGTEMPADEVTIFFSDMAPIQAASTPKKKRKMSEVQAFKLFPELAYFF